MKRFIPIVVIAAVCMGSVTQTALAIKPFGDAWNEHYLKDSKDEELKKLAGEAKCNVCHTGKEKKNRNPYGQALNKLINKKEFEKLSKEDKAKANEYVLEAFKKVEGEKAKDSDKTFKERMDAHMLPGGDKDGK